jgi:dicarboxylate transporter 10
MAACFTHPFDQTKYRMQVLSTRVSFSKTLTAFVTRDGVLSLWSGLSASILRQSTYSTARFALYESISRNLNSQSIYDIPSPYSTIASAGIAGGIAGVIGNPAEIVLVRMCADAAKPATERFGYSNAISGLIRVGREDGLAAYFRGLGPNVIRSVLMNISQIATYTEAKRRLLANPQMGFKDDVKTHIVASCIAGTVATTVCAPADVLKSRFQNSRGDHGTSIIRYTMQTIRTQGPGFLMKGWTPAWLRLAPNTVLTFVFLEQLKKLVISN